MMPNQKEGADCPMRAIALLSWSRTLPRLMAERTPRGIPITSEKMKAASPSCRVGHRRPRMESMTGRCSLIDRPKSPLNTSLMNMRYC